MAFLKGFDDDVENVSIHELYSRVTVLGRMIEAENVCRRYIVTTDPTSWSTVGRSTFAELKRLCVGARNNIRIEIERRTENSDVKDGA